MVRTEIELQGRNGNTILIIASVHFLGSISKISKKKIQKAKNNPNHDSKLDGAYSGVSGLSGYVSWNTWRPLDWKGGTHARYNAVSRGPRFARSPWSGPHGSYPSHASRFAQVTSWFNRSQLEIDEIPPKSSAKGTARLRASAVERTVAVPPIWES